MFGGNNQEVRIAFRPRRYAPLCRLGAPLQTVLLASSGEILFFSSGVTTPCLCICTSLSSVSIVNGTPLRDISAIEQKNEKHCSPRKQHARVCAHACACLCDCSYTCMHITRTTCHIHVDDGQARRSNSRCCGVRLLSVTWFNLNFLFIFEPSPAPCFCLLAPFDVLPWYTQHSCTLLHKVAYS